MCVCVRARQSSSGRNFFFFFLLLLPRPEDWNKINLECFNRGAEEIRRESNEEIYIFLFMHHEFILIIEQRQDSDLLVLRIYNRLKTSRRNTLFNLLGQRLLINSASEFREVNLSTL